MSRKNLHLILLNLLSPDDVKLGRIVKDPLSPVDSYVDPQLPLDEVRNNTSTKVINDLRTLVDDTQTRGISGALSKLFWAYSSRTTLRAENIQGTKVETHRLRNFETVFDQAIAQVTIQDWLNRAYETRRSAFMITGYSTVQDLRIEVSNSTHKSASAEIDVASAIRSTTGVAVTPLAGNATVEVNQNSAVEGVVPGETVWAILYRKIKLHATPAKSSLPPCTSSKANQWMMMLKTRAQTEQAVTMEAELDSWNGDGGSAIEDYMEFSGELVHGEDGNMYYIPECDDSEGDDSTEDDVDTDEDEDDDEEDKEDDDEEDDEEEEEDSEVGERSE